MKSVLIIGIILAVIVIGVFLLALTNPNLRENKETWFGFIDVNLEENITGTTYKYNTICDVGDPLEFLQVEVLQVEGEILGGIHNENENLVKFFKENEILGRLNITPDQIYGITPDESKGVGPNYDPIFYDMMFLIPPALEIMDASPEFVELFTVQEGDSQSSYANRLHSEKNKCS